MLVEYVVAIDFQVLQALGVGDFVLKDILLAVWTV